VKLIKTQVKNKISENLNLNLHTGKSIDLLLQHFFIPHRNDCHLLKFFIIFTTIMKKVVFSTFPKMALLQHKEMVSHPFRKFPPVETPWRYKMADSPPPSFISEKT
jgi:hypothetical protein